jgi:hypothetical protein
VRFYFPNFIFVHFFCFPNFIFLLFFYFPNSILLPFFLLLSSFLRVVPYSLFSLFLLTDVFIALCLPSKYLIFFFFFFLLFFTSAALFFLFYLSLLPIILILLPLFLCFSNSVSRLFLPPYLFPAYVHNTISPL